MYMRARLCVSDKGRLLSRIVLFLYLISNFELKTTEETGN